MEAFETGEEVAADYTCLDESVDSARADEEKYSSAMERNPVNDLGGMVSCDVFRYNTINE
jgi:hypothetical protein